jgi:hypothetical protein
MSLVESPDFSSAPDSSVHESESSVAEGTAGEASVESDAPTHEVAGDSTPELSVESHEAGESSQEKNLWGKIVDGARSLYEKAMNLPDQVREATRERAKGYEKKALTVNETMRLGAVERLKDFRQKIDRQAYGTVNDDQLDLLQQELKNTQDYLFSAEAVLKAGGTYERLVTHRNYLENMVKVIDVRMKKQQAASTPAYEATDQRMAA